MFYTDKRSREIMESWAPRVVTPDGREVGIYLTWCELYGTDECGDEDLLERHLETAVLVDEDGAETHLSAGIIFDSLEDMFMDRDDEQPLYVEGTEDVGLW